MEKIGLIKGLIDILKANKLSALELKELQDKRFKDLVIYAKNNSEYYKKLYSDIDNSYELSNLPVTNKKDLMDNFDTWVTDKDITISEIKEFMSDLNNIGREYKDKYLVYTTSGSTGTPVIILYDNTSMNVVTDMEVLRSFARKQDMIDFIKNGGKTVGLFVTDGFYLGYASVIYNLRKMPWKRNKLRVLSVYDSIDEIVKKLNKIKPSMLGGYPTALQLLIKEKEEGRLNINPVIIMSGGEQLTDSLRNKLSSTFNCFTQTNYSCTEVGPIACECECGNFHINEDWCIVEPVDMNNNPVKYGELSDKILVTNLHNYVMPMIRYEITDRVIVHNEKCKCGKNAKYLEIEGRTDDILTFTTNTGEKQIIPLAIDTVIENIPNVQLFELIKYPDNTIEIKLDCEKNKEELFEIIKDSLNDYFNKQGIFDVSIVLSKQSPERTLKSGKFKKIHNA